MNETPREPILQVRDLNFSYPDSPPLWTHWSASVGAGITLLHGDTGSGKSTLLRLLAGGQPVDGRLTVGGVALADDPAAYRRQVFFCDPSTDEFDAIPARACAQALCAGDAGFDLLRWQALVEGFGLVEHIDKPVYMLSTGSRRKLWLTTALAAGRPLILLDEPTAALDAGSVRCLWDALAASAARGRRAVLVASAERLTAVPLTGSIDL